MMGQQGGSASIPLTSLREGETGIVVSIGSNPGRGRWGGGWGFTRRLMDMGLTPGTHVKVVKAAPFRGPVEVLVRGARLAIGRGMAERIVVEVRR